jgi:hypothetical protein
MACPLFLPIPQPDDPYSGICAADPGVPVPAPILRSCCRRGYARGACERAGHAEADAVRFLIKSDSDGEVVVAWAREHDHHPLAVGVASALSPGTGDETLDAQISAYAASYIRHRERTSYFPAQK